MTSRQEQRALVIMGAIPYALQGKYCSVILFSEEILKGLPTDGPLEEAQELIAGAVNSEFVYCPHIRCGFLLLGKTTDPGMVSSELFVNAAKHCELPYSEIVEFT